MAAPRNSPGVITIAEEIGKLVYIAGLSGQAANTTGVIEEKTQTKEVVNIAEMLQPGGPGI